MEGAPSKSPIAKVLSTEPPTALPPASLQAISDCPPADPCVFPAQQSPAHTPPAKRLLKSARNVFGLFQQYYAECFPHHDPDKNIVQNDLIDSSPDSPCTLALHDYYPYPNNHLFCWKNSIGTMVKRNCNIASRTLPRSLDIQIFTLMTSLGTTGELSTPS